MELVLLDTDMLSEVLKQRHAQVVAKRQPTFVRMAVLRSLLSLGLKSHEDSKRNVRQVS